MQLRDVMARDGCNLVTAEPGTNVPLYQPLHFVGGGSTVALLDMVHDIPVEQVADRWRIDARATLGERMQFIVIAQTGAKILEDPNSLFARCLDIDTAPAADGHAMTCSILIAILHDKRSH